MNGYPVAFAESLIRRQLNLTYTPCTIIPTVSETNTIVLRVPYYGKQSQIYAKRVTAVVTKQYLSKKVRVVYDVTDRIGQNFTTKTRYQQNSNRALFTRQIVLNARNNTFEKPAAI